MFNTSNSECDECIGLRPYSSPTDVTNDTANRVRREEELLDPLPPYDGTLDINSNYTGFVEVLGKQIWYFFCNLCIYLMFTVRSADHKQVLATYSSYLMMMNPGPEVVVAPSASTFGLVIQVLCALVVVTLLLLTTLYILHRYTKQAHAQAVEMITFRTSLR